MLRNDDNVLECDVFGKVSSFKENLPRCVTFADTPYGSVTLDVLTYCDVLPKSVMLWAVAEKAER